MSAICPYRWTGTTAVTGRPLRRLISLPASSTVHCFFRYSREFCGIHVVRLLIDVDELRQRAGLRNRFRGGDESVRHGDHNVAGLHSGRPSGRSAERRCRC